MNCVRLALFFFTICLPVFGADVEKGLPASGLDEFLAFASNYGFSGAVLVAQDDKILLRKAYGLADRETNRPLTPDSVFDIGSLTKQFTAAAILKLEMQGKLHTYDPITNFFDQVPEDKRKITVHQLLTHTAGLPEYSGEDYDVAPRDKTITSILNTPLEFEPGTQYKYSNAGYSVLAAVVEKVSGKPYEVFLHEFLFEPAGMKNTGYVIPKWDKKSLPHGYYDGKDEGTPLDHLWSDQGPYWNLLGNGGILSTTEDLFLWVKALQGNTILSEEAKKKMYTPFLNDYAYGWLVRKGEFGTKIGHGGASDNGFNASVQRYVDRDLVIITGTNAGDYPGAGPFATVIANTVADILFGKGPKIPQSSTFVSLTPDSQKKIAGSYRLSPNSSIRINEDQGEIVAQPQGQEAINLLVSGTLSGPAEFAALNRTADAVVQGVLKKDIAPLKNALADPSRAERYQRYIEENLQEWQNSDGKFIGAEILGTVTTWWDNSDGDTVATFLRFRFENGEHIGRFHWKDGKIFGLGGSGISSPASTPLRAQSQSKLLGFHLVIGRAIPFEMNGDGSLTIAGVKATKEK